jgi:hypothetical protein
MPNEWRKPIDWLGRTGRSSPAVFSLALLYFVAMGAAAVHISILSYAPWPDEMWGYHMTVGVLHNETPRSVLTFPLFGHYLPYVSGNYQGALKLHLHLIFLALGGDAAPEYHRYINLVLLIAVGLAMAWAIRPIAPSWLAAVPLLLAVSDPEYVVFLQTDMGPFLMQNLLTALSFGFLLRVCLGAGPRQLAAALFFASAIVGDKLTGIPVAIGLGLACAGVAIARRDTLLSPRWIAVYLIVPIIPVLPNIIYIWRAGLSAVTAALKHPDTLADRLHRIAVEIESTSSGAYSYMLDAIYRVPTAIGIPHYYFAIASLTVVMVSACAFAASARRTPPASAAMLLVLIVAGAVPVFLSVEGLGRPWHFLIFNPLVYMTMAAIVAWGVCYGLSAGNTVVRHAVAVCLAALVVNFGLAQYNVISLLSFQARHQGKELASLAVYPLLEKLRALGVKTAVCIDYSPCASVYILTSGAIKIADLAYSADFDKEPLDALLRKPDTVLVLREISGIENRAWDERIQKGTTWFRSDPAKRRSLPPLETLPLERVGDTQYTLLRIARPQ